jgi:hypothetical protein
LAHEAAIVTERAYLINLPDTVIRETGAGSYSVWSVRRWLGDYPRREIGLEQHTSTEFFNRFVKAFPEACRIDGFAKRRAERGDHRPTKGLGSDGDAAIVRFFLAQHFRAERRASG